jgi:hypothetical protein
MTEITRFQAVAFDLVDGRLADSEVVDCASPALAIQTAKGQWKCSGTPVPLRSAAPAILKQENLAKNTYCAATVKYRMIILYEALTGSEELR